MSRSSAPGELPTNAMRAEALSRGFGLVVLSFALVMILVAYLETQAATGPTALIAAAGWLVAGAVLGGVAMARFLGRLPDKRLSLATTVCVLAHSTAAVIPIVVTGDGDRFLSLVFALLTPAGLLVSARAIAINSVLCLAGFGVAGLLHPTTGLDDYLAPLGYTIVATVLVAMSRLYGLERTDRLVRELADQADIDHLTGLLNRLGLHRRLHPLVRGQKRPVAFGVIWIDLDGFKKINDQLGHAQGDEVLILVADRLRAATRAGDLVARVGGDEFVVVLPGVERAEVGDECRRLNEALRGHIGPQGVTWSASIGTAHGMCDDDAGVSYLLRSADLAMFDHKQCSRSAADPDLIRVPEAITEVPRQTAQKPLGSR